MLGLYAKKCSKMAKNTWLTIAVVAIIAIVAFQYLGQKSTTVTNPGQNVGGNIITTNPTLKVSAFDAAQPGTSVTVTGKANINNGGYVTDALAGGTTLVPGNTVALLVNASSYHSAKVDAFTVKVDSFPIVVKMNANASATITAFNNNNVAIDGTATNQSVSAGTSPTNALRFNGQSLKSTQDLTCVLEESNKTAVNQNLGITLATGTPRSIPLNFYTLAGVNSVVYVYDLPALTSAADVLNSVTTNCATTSGYSLGGSTLKITCYTKEYFVDSVTGAMTYDIQDSTGTLQSIMRFTKTITFT